LQTIADAELAGETPPHPIIAAFVIDPGERGSAPAGTLATDAVDRPLLISGQMRRSRWTSFVADPAEDPPRTLREDGNPAHRLRVEHDKDVLLIKLSGEDGEAWTVFAVDRPTRRVAVAQARRQIDATEQAYRELKRSDPS
jgi:hypothetical protein